MSHCIHTVSISPIWSKIMQDFNISPSKALKNGLALELALRYPDFPRNDIEEALYADSIVPAYKALLIARVTALTK